MVISPPLGVVTEVSTTLAGPEPSVVAVPPGGVFCTTTSSANVRAPGCVVRARPGKPPALLTALLPVGDRQARAPSVVGSEVLPTGGVAVPATSIDPPTTPLSR